MKIKKYKLPNSKIAVFEYDESGVGKVTLECMDELMAMVAERPQGEWINDTRYSGWTCSNCNYHDGNRTDNFCPNCGADMRGEAERMEK